MNAVNVKRQTWQEKAGRIAGRTSVYAVLLLFAVWMMAPFLIIIIVSFEPDLQFAREGFQWWPDWSAEGYTMLFDPENEFINMLLTGFFNSLWQTLIPTVGGLFVSGMAAYAYAKWDFPGKNKFFALCLVLMTVPLNAGLASYLFYNAIGWTSGGAAVLPIIIPGLFGSMGAIFLIYPYIKAVPDGIVEAARIDGMGFLGIYCRIIIPLASPVFVAQFLFGFVGGYNNYASALLYLFGNESLWTMQLALSQLIGGLSESGAWLNVKCAAAIFSMLPLIVLFYFSQKYFIENVSAGSVKG